MTRLYRQKYWLKLVCKLLLILGLGTFWYKKTDVSFVRKILYKIWCFIFIFYEMVLYIDIWLAQLRSDLNEKESNDLIQFNTGLTVILSKSASLLFLKERIKFVLKTLLEDKTVSRLYEKESVIKSIKYCIALFFALYMTLLFAVVDAYKAHKTGIPYKTVIVLYPTPADNGLLVTILKILVEIHWWTTVTFMYATDCLCTFTLVFTEYRFKRLRLYFEELSNINEGDFSKWNTKYVISEEYKRRFEAGIRMHENALRCTRNVQYTMGTLSSVQIVATIAMIVICLVKIVTSDRSLTSVMANLTYLTCLVVMCSTYMTLAGNITYQASKLSTSIFHSGWEQMHMDPALRKMLVITMIRSQAPLHMTAFGVLHLSHENLISVFRSSYSFFAVMY